MKIDVEANFARIKLGVIELRCVSIEFHFNTVVGFVFYLTKAQNKIERLRYFQRKIVLQSILIVNN